MSKKVVEDNKSEHNEQEEKLAQLDKEELDKIADEDEEDLKELKGVCLRSQLCNIFAEVL
jgi:ribosomal protein L11